MLIIPWIAKLGGALAFYGVLVILILFGVSFGIVQASTFSMTGGLPPMYMGCLMLGPGVSGISSGLLRFASLWIFPGVKGDPDSLFPGALAYYYFTAAFLFTNGFLMYKLVRNEFAIYHLWQFPGFKPAEVEALELDPSATFDSIVGSASLRLSQRELTVVKRKNVTFTHVINTLKFNFTTT